MKRFIVCFLALALVLSFAPAVAQAQQAAAGAAVTSTGARGDAATQCNSVTGTSQQTLTLPTPGAGLSHYLNTVAVYGLGNGAVTTALPTQSTMTAVGTNSTAGFIPLGSGWQGTAHSTGAVTGGPVPLTTPIKMSAATAGTIVGPTAITNMNQLIQECHYDAP